MQAAATAATKPTVAAVQPTPVKPGGILRVAIPTFGSDGVDPINGDPEMIDTIGGVYDWLVGNNADGTIGPGVAQSWEQSPDGLTFTFHLRKGLQFNENWGEVTADDVKYSLSRQIGPQSKSLWAGTLGKAIKSIDVVDPYTVRINMKEVLLDMPFMLSTLGSVDGMIVPKKYIEQKGDEEFRRHPVGSGPFKLVEHVPGNKYEYQAITDPEHYKNHYRVMPSFERLQLLMAPEEATRVAMLRAGQVDLADVTPERVDELQKAGLRVAEVPMAYQLNLHYWDTFTSEVARQPIADIRVRRALSMAINREETVRFLLRGYGDGTPLPPRMFPFVMDIDAAYWKSYSQKTYKYDPLEARRLLAEAGFNNFEIMFYSYSQQGVPIEPKLAETIAGYWSAIGVKTNLVPMEFGSFRSLWTAKPHNSKLFGTVSILQAPPRYLMGSSLQLSFHSKGSIGTMNDPETDKLIDALLSEPDAAKRRDLTQKVAQITADSQTIVPLLYGSSLYGISDNIEQWKPIPGAAHVGLTFEGTKRRVK